MRISFCRVFLLVHLPCGEGTDAAVIREFRMKENIPGQIESFIRVLAEREHVHGQTGNAAPFLQLIVLPFEGIVVCINGKLFFNFLKRSRFRGQSTKQEGKESVIVKKTDRDGRCIQHESKIKVLSIRNGGVDIADSVFNNVLDSSR